MHKVLYAAGGIAWTLAAVTVYLLFSALPPDGTLGPYGVDINVGHPMAIEMIGQVITLALTLFTCGTVFIVGGAIVREIKRRN